VLFIEGKDYNEIMNFAKETNFDPRFFTLKGLKILKPNIFKVNLKKLKEVINNDE
jgi:hypothetical protein